MIYTLIAMILVSPIIIHEMRDFFTLFIIIIITIILNTTNKGNFFSTTLII